MYYVQIMQLLNPDAQVAEHRQQRLLTIVIFCLGALSQLLVERAAIAILRHDYQCVLVSENFFDILDAHVAYLCQQTQLLSQFCLALLAFLDLPHTVEVLVLGAADQPCCARLLVVVQYL